jgi:hypothetical protein
MIGKRGQEPFSDVQSFGLVAAEVRTCLEPIRLYKGKKVPDPFFASARFEGKREIRRAD